jgi:membrane-associated HD superfamily phosphohydrolase
MYYLFTVNKYDKTGHARIKKKKLNKNDIDINDYNKLPNEVKIFVDKYKIDTSKINIRGLLKSIGFIIALSITFGLLIANRITKVPIIQIGIILLITFTLYLISLVIICNYLKKKGYVKDGHKKNRK